MTPLGSRATVAVAALTLTAALGLAATACSADDGDGQGGAHSKEQAGTGAPSRSPGGTGSPQAGTSPSDSATPSPTESASSPGKGTPKGGVPRPEEVDQKNADAVGKGALTAMWTYDTTVDDGPQDAGARTAEAGWLTPSYERQLLAHRPQAAPDAQWQEWEDHRAWTAVKLAKTEDAAKPEDTDTVAWRQWTLTTTPHGRDGWTQKPTSSVAYVHLVRKAATGVWRVNGVTVR